MSATKHSSVVDQKFDKFSNRIHSKINQKIFYRVTLYDFLLLKNRQLDDADTKHVKLVTKK